MLNPGLHFRELQRKLDMPVGLLDYHLDYLTKNGLLVAKEEGYYTRYYRRDRFGQEEKEIISVLRQALPRGIVLYLLQHPYSKHKEILDNFHVTGATLSYHLKRMVEKGVLMRYRKGREAEYAVADEVKVTNLLIAYRRSFMDKLVDNFAKAWLEKR